MSSISVDMIDNTVSSSWWKELVRRFVRVGDELEIRCWKEEAEEIKTASRYGKPTAERTEVSIRGTVTDAFLRELMDEEPTTRSGYHAMTKYFTINVKNELCAFYSEHYGTEICMENLRENDVSFVEDVFGQWGDTFSVGIYRD